MINYFYNKKEIVFKTVSMEEELYVVGSFTNWLISEEFKMAKKDGVFYLEKNIKEINKIANSGYPEYYFGNRNGKMNFDKTYPKGYYFNNQANKDFNYLVLPEDIKKCELEEIYANNLNSFRIKNRPEEFKDYEELTNFRELLGGELGRKKLFRSYHPAIPSRENNGELRDIEIIRQNILKDLLEKYSIGNIINLSEKKEELQEFLEKSSLDYYKKLYLEGRIYNVPMSYETVYFMSDKNENFKEGELGFKDGIKAIIRFISKNSGPFLVHCRLGSDRTGVVSGFLQLFMGASKEEVRDNYIKTNNLGIGEYRSFNLLEYSLKNALGQDCFENYKVKNYLKSIGLEEDTIERAYENLK